MLSQTIDIGYSAWVFLLVGIVAWLRSTGRGRRGWEPATLVVVASLAPVLTCVVNYFHPQDLMALGLSLIALACAQRDRWIAAGVFIGLAVLTQQYAVLVAVPLLAVVPRDRRFSFFSAALGSAVLVVAPILIATSGTALRAVTLGSGDNPNPAVGGSLVFSLGLHGAASVLVTRILPVLIALLASIWVVRRLGAASREPTVMISLVATSLALRLVFELAIFSYYFLALAVTVILIEVANKQIRSSVVAWLASVSVVYAVNAQYSLFTGATWNSWARLVVSLLVVLTALVIVVVGLMRSWSRWSILFAVVTIGLASGTWSTAFGTPLFHHPPPWLWQIVFVSWGLALAANPLLHDVRRGIPSGSPVQGPRPADAIAQ